MASGIEIITIQQDKLLVTKMVNILKYILSNVQLLLITMHYNSALWKKNKNKEY